MSVISIGVCFYNMNKSFINQGIAFYENGLSHSLCDEIWESYYRNISHSLPGITISGKSVGPDNVKWKDDEMEYTAVLSKQSMLYNQFRYLCEMRDLLYSNKISDDGFDSTVWTANLFLTYTAKKTGKPLAESSDFWKYNLPTLVKDPDNNRFMRLLQSLTIPTVPKM